MRFCKLGLLAAMCGAAFGQDEPGRIKFKVSEAMYDSGTRALDNRRYDDAVRDFDRVIEGKSTRSDGALYWKAYALNRLGRRDEALAAVSSLRRDFPNSRWLIDAQALEVEAKQGAGKPVSPDEESNEELKLMAINGLMNADPARAIPLLEGVLKGSGSPKLKDRAMFVLTQSHSPQAQQVIANYAKSAANPDLQLRAIRYIGMAGTAESRQQLIGIYKASNDAEVKKTALRSMAMTDRSGAGAELVGLYGPEKDPEVKAEILNLLSMRGDAKDMVELARKEPDAAMKKRIVERLSVMRNKDATDYMMELLK